MGTPRYEDYPFEGKHLSLDGGRMHYLDEGKGPAVVMVHGNPTWSYYYRKLVSALRNTHRVLVPDHIGMGLSDKPNDDAYPHTLERRIADLDALIEHAGLEGPITLIAHDWGGMIGLGWAVEHADRIGRLVLSNTAGFPMPAGKREPKELRLVRSPLGAPLVRGLNLFCRGAARRCVVKRPLTPGARAGFLAPYDSWANRRAVLRFVEDIPLTPEEPAYPIVANVGEQLTRFRETPTLLLWGMQDFVFDPDYLAEFERRMPWADAVRFGDCGHYLLEDDFDAVLPHVQRFLEVPAAQPSA